MKKVDYKEFIAVISVALNLLNFEYKLFNKL